MTLSKKKPHRNKRLNVLVDSQESRTQPGRHNPFLQSLRICAFPGGEKVAIRGAQLVQGGKRAWIPTERAMTALVARHFPPLLPLLRPSLGALRAGDSPLFPPGRPGAVFALIATCGRLGLLLGRSLPSALKQTQPPRHVVVVMDCDVGREELEQRLASAGLVKRDPADGTWTWQLGRVPGGAGSKRDDHVVPVSFVNNSRTMRSASGAWNAGLHVIRGLTSEAEGAWVAILDDDDSWEDRHLEACADALQRHGSRCGSAEVGVVLAGDGALKPKTWQPIFNCGAWP